MSSSLTVQRLAVVPILLFLLTTNSIITINNGSFIVVHAFSTLSLVTTTTRKQILGTMISRKTSSSISLSYLEEEEKREENSNNNNNLSIRRLSKTVSSKSRQRSPSPLSADVDDAKMTMLSRKDFGRKVILSSLISQSLFFFGGEKQSSMMIANAMYTDSKTGIVLPEIGEIESSIPNNWKNVDNPFIDLDEKSSFGRLDSSSDSIFYTDPRFVEHIDNNAVQLITSYVSSEAIMKHNSNDNNNEKIAVLDLCSSWTSHITENVAKDKCSKISGLGMNEKELESNKVLTDYVVYDLNRGNVKLPYDDNTYDVVVCQLSIDYLTKPLDVLKDIYRILKPNGGKVHIIYSNRLFIQKAVALWTGSDDIDHTYTVGCYLHFCCDDNNNSSGEKGKGGGFVNIKAIDLSTRKNKKIVGDPLYVVTATKQ